MKLTKINVSAAVVTISEHSVFELFQSTHSNRSARMRERHFHSIYSVSLISIAGEGTSRSHVFLA